MFVSPAFAQAGGAAAGPDIFQMLLPLLLIFAVFYILILRPQQKQAKQRKEMLAAIRRGDRIVTGGGVYGTVTKVIDDNDVMVEIAEGVRVRVQRVLVSTVVAKTEPATGAPTKEASNDAGKADGQQSGGSRLKKILGGKSD